MSDLLLRGIIRSGIAFGTAAALTPGRKRQGRERGKGREVEANPNDARCDMTTLLLIAALVAFGKAGW